MAAEAMYIRSKQAEPWLDETHKSLRRPAVTGGREGQRLHQHLHQHLHLHLDGVDYLLLDAVGGAGEGEKVKPTTGLTVEHVVLQHDTDSRSFPWASRWREERSGFDTLFGAAGGVQGMGEGFCACQGLRRLLKQEEAACHLGPWAAMARPEAPHDAGTDDASAAAASAAAAAAGNAAMTGR
ncbi:hypothetical protein COCMIDRAFT_22982 [Bipolaris oryzae ATCC 44560]|uniref:Uncharacterized protein n=1 Tax=Bipolaris oryzae ATCC 44560 TaxID=930090 RepID=W6ZC82_COCMI|nr:uncharacterized protein COCMIDRAFT_22982 [Bipolaris oryzae ATCC 44560]EUC49402.1 hypothetical protein COCMIDRAFT_22982 [Bipolaris oryzae ATCC 44560]